MPALKEILSTSLGEVDLNRLLSGLGVLVVCLVIVRLVMRLVRRLTERSAKIQGQMGRVLLKAVKILLYILTGILTAEALGLNTSSLTALLSVLTLGVTLAAEDILGNVAGGLVLLSTHPFSPGQVIEIDGVVGTVREITLTHTHLETADGQRVLQPNRALASSRIVNYSVLGRRRIARSVSVAYDAPTDAVKAACMEALSTVPGILPDPAPAVRLTDFGASAIVYVLCAWTATDDYWTALFALNEAIRPAFAAHGVEMTYDHLNVHIVPPPETT